MARYPARDKAIDGRLIVLHERHLRVVLRECVARLLRFQKRLTPFRDRHRAAHTPSGGILDSLRQ
jgi:hypothetical protein